MQRGPQPWRDQQHQLHHAGEQQLARVLPLPMGLEYLVDPAERQCPVQRQVGHDRTRCLLLESLNDFLPDFLLLDRWGDSRIVSSLDDYA